ncbi:MAG: hypothetical protein ACHQ01_02475 [Candidatus Limnocylindrales bacterium]
MSRKLLSVLVAVLVVAAAFGAGYWIRGNNGVHPPIYTADRCDTGEIGGSCIVGNTTYGFESPPSWTDNVGVFHDRGWPVCLPPMSSVKGLRIAADWLFVGSGGEARVFWVDCQNR